MWSKLSLFCFLSRFNLLSWLQTLKILHLVFITHRFQFDFYFNIRQMLQNLSFEILLMIFAVTISGMTLFLYCYYGKYATDCQAAFALSAYEMDWINFPIEFQRYFILIIANAQLPLSYHGYGIVDLNLETFAKVSLIFVEFVIFLMNFFSRFSQIFKTVISYYVMFKTLTQDV